MKSPKSDRGHENGDATSPGVRRNTPRAARKRRSFADIFDSDDGSDPEYDPREYDPRSNKNKKVKKEHVVNGDASPSKPRRRSSKSRMSYTEEPDEGKRKSKRERKPSHKGKMKKSVARGIVTQRELHRYVA